MEGLAEDLSSQAICRCHVQSKVKTYTELGLWGTGSSDTTVLATT